MSRTGILIVVNLGYLLYPLELIVIFILSCLKQVFNFWVFLFNFHTTVTVLYNPRWAAFIKFLMDCLIFVEFVLIPLSKSVLRILIDFILPVKLDILIKFMAKPNSSEIIFLWFMEFCGELVFNTATIFYLIVSYILSFVYFLKSGLPLLSDIFNSFFNFCDIIVETAQLLKIYYHPYQWEMYKMLVEEEKQKNEKFPSEDNSEDNSQGGNNSE